MKKLSRFISLKTQCSPQKTKNKDQTTKPSIIFEQDKKRKVSNSNSKVIKTFRQIECFTPFQKDKQNSNKFRSRKFFKLKKQSKNQINEIIIKQIDKRFKTKQDQQLIRDWMSQVFWLSEEIVSSIYSYQKIEQLLKKILILIKKFESSSLIFQVYTFAANVLFTYGSFSLSIFYFDKALKKFSSKSQIKMSQIKTQTLIYKTIAKIFLAKADYNEAKHFCYKYLRKAWFQKNIQQQLSAYDLLGKIYHQEQNRSMSKYFHQRMCRGQKQKPQLIKISNYQLQKANKNKTEFPVYETIQLFVQKDKQFQLMLQDRYRTESTQYLLQNQKLNTQFYFHTNRSPNRVLANYRILQRKMIDQKQSKQLHFLKPSQIPNLKQSITGFINMILKLKESYQQLYDQNSYNKGNLLTTR